MFPLHVLLVLLLAVLLVSLLSLLFVVVGFACCMCLWCVYCDAYSAAFLATSCAFFVWLGGLFLLAVAPVLVLLVLLLAENYRGAPISF